MHAPKHDIFPFFCFPPLFFKKKCLILVDLKKLKTLSLTTMEMDTSILMVVTILVTTAIHTNKWILLDCIRNVPRLITIIAIGQSAPLLLVLEGKFWEKNAFIKQDLKIS
jgi:hypothetical protein